MTVPFAPEIVALAVLVVLIAGTINGIAGFGFAVVGTMALASEVDPATAVVFMIIPILSVNVSLVRDLSAAELRSCSQRFAPLMVAALVGTIVGLATLELIPEAPLRTGLGLVTLAFVAGVQRRVPLPGLARAKERCFVESPAAMVGIGGVSGVLFGGTNVGVQLIAYLRSRDLSHGVFVGVVAMVFLGLNAVRVAAAALFGLYPNVAVVGASVAAIVPAVAGVTLGKYLRDAVAERHRRGTVLALLLVIGIRLLLGGLEIA